MKHLWIASTWINALLKEFDAMNLNRIELTLEICQALWRAISPEGDRLDLLSARLLVAQGGETFRRSFVGQQDWAEC